MYTCAPTLPVTTSSDKAQQIAKLRMDLFIGKYKKPYEKTAVYVYLYTYGFYLYTYIYTHLYIRIYLKPFFLFIFNMLNNEFL